MLGRVVHSDDFKRLLGTPTRSRSAHFAVHYVAGRPGVTETARQAIGTEDLSTGAVDITSTSVDKSVVTHWLGAVLPKRHARRAVTRNLLRRQIRGAILRHVGHLPPGVWLVRLRSPFARSDFVSAASEALRKAAGSELDAMFAPSAR